MSPTILDIPEPERVPWDRFRASFSRSWQPGEMVFVVGTINSGKSVLNRELLRMSPRRNWLVLDAKGGDDPSLAGLDGYELLRNWPPHHKVEQAIPSSIHDFVVILREYMRRGEPVSELPREAKHYRLAPHIRSFEDIYRNAGVFDRALRHVFVAKGQDAYSVLIDEGQIIAMPRPEGMGLGSRIAPMIRQKRYHGCSVVLSTQWPVWIPKSTYGEARWRFYFRIFGRERLNDAADIAGSREFVPLLRSIKGHNFLCQDIVRDRLYISQVAA